MGNARPVQKTPFLNMANLVLYRKYRPKTFGEVIGQEHIVKTLTNGLSRNIISHGYLFAGPHGTGKTTLARLLAKSLNCQNRKPGQFEPCNQCDSCLEINQGNALDLIEIDAASNRGIDEIRELKDGVRFSPAKSKYKVFIIDESHQLTKEAANALLKTLEEPPGHALFVLATTEIHKMLPTIISRCQRFDFRKLTVPEITKRLEGILKQEKIPYTKEALSLIALQATGAVRDAESLLDEAISFAGENKEISQETIQALLGLANKPALLKFLSFLVQKKAKEAIEFLNEMVFAGIDLKEFTKSVLEYLRQIFLLKIDVQDKSPLFLSQSPEEKSQLLAFANTLTEQELKQAIEAVGEAENKMKQASIVQLPLELAVVDICLKNQ